MITVLLVIIYVAFISLGLPDAVLGAAWPAMHLDLGVRIELAGLLQMTVAGGTIISSINAGRILRRFGTGPVMALSVFLTAIALAGFAVFPTFWWFFLGAVPLGLGAGAVDTGLNAFVAAHYKSRHMSWLHSFWGVGALGGPFILSLIMGAGQTWRRAYIAIAIFQCLLILVLLFSLPLWRKLEKKDTKENKKEDTAPHLSVFQLLRIKGVPSATLVFLFYCGVEASMGLWGGTWLVKMRDMPVAEAAFWVSMYFSGIAGGRFLTGFITFYLKNDTLIRIGGLVVAVGIILLFLPAPLALNLLGFVLIGLGCAPIFPCMIHETPVRFGLKDSPAIIGIQMASAYMGITFLPPFFGLMSRFIGLGTLPIFLAVYTVCMLFYSERVRSIKFSSS